MLEVGKGGLPRSPGVVRVQKSGGKPPFPTPRMPGSTLVLDEELKDRGQDFVRILITS